MRSATASKKPSPRPSGRPAHRARRNTGGSHRADPEVLTKSAASATESISAGIVIKSGDLFFMTDANGSVPLSDRHGFGLYREDCRYLNGHVMRFNDKPLNVLLSNADSGHASVTELTNPDVGRNGQSIPRDQIGVRVERVIEAEAGELRERVTLRNFGHAAHRFRLSVEFRADFEDVFIVRGLMSGPRGKLLPTRWRKNQLRFEYVGVDAVRRHVEITFSGLAFRRKRAGVEFSLNLDRGKEAEFQIVIAVGEETKSDAGGRPRRPAPGRSNLEIRQGLDQSAAKWIADFARVKSDSILLTQLMDRSLKDLRMLLSNRDGFGYFSAGTPWFATVFGRDSLLTSIEALPYHGETAADVLRLLSAHQSRRTNEWTDEQPGKILHELRRGELARVGAIPHSPYYGGIDTTLLYLILMARYLRWTGDRALFDQLRPNMEAALRWSLTDADSNGDGYIDYTTGSDGGLANKGWKDSGDAVVDKKGRFPPGPIALIEVQAYAYAAWSEIADIFEAEGETARARELRQRAAGMRQRLNKDYWVDSEGTFAFYIDGKGRRGDTVVSNAGHALWAGAAEPEKARLTAKRLMADDMFSGWGIRTLAEGEAAYNPVGYHLGSVWPHDNMMIAAGLRRYGLDAEALKVCEAMFQAGLYFDYHRLPELFCGFGRDRHSIPVHYPVACHPQAWAAGAVPYGLSICLGLEPDAARNRLRIVRPQLPSFARNVEIAGLRVGRGRVHFSVTRRDDGRCETRVIDDGGVTVEVG